MQRSTERILTTHVGSLIRTPAIMQGLKARTLKQPYDQDRLAEDVRQGIAEVVREQVAEGGLASYRDGVKGPGLHTYQEVVDAVGEENIIHVKYEPVSKDDPRMLVVVTEASLSIKPSLLGIVHPGNLPASATARARPYEGVTRAEE